MAIAKITINKKSGKQFNRLKDKDSWPDNMRQKTAHCETNDAYILWFTTPDKLVQKFPLTLAEGITLNQSDIVQAEEESSNEIEPITIPEGLLQSIKNHAGLFAGVIDAAELMKKEFPPRTWFVSGLYSTGFHSINGSPKVGKGWFIINMAYATTCGTPFLGFDTTKTKTLLLGLEDSTRRLQERSKKINANYETDMLAIATDWPTGEEGILLLEKYIKVTSTRLVFIDTWGRFAGIENGNDYAEVTATAGRVQKIAHELDVCIFVVHHTKKKKEDDFLSDSLGSTGLAGAADSVSVLTRPRGESIGKLQITGRDIEEQELNIKLDMSTMQWGNSEISTEPGNGKGSNIPFKNEIGKEAQEFEEEQK